MVKRRRHVLVLGLLFIVIGMTWGTGVFNAVGAGGFDDPNSEAQQTAKRIANTFGKQDVDVIAMYTNETTIDDPAFSGAVRSVVADLRGADEVARVGTYYDENAPVFVSKDRRATYLAVTLRPSEDDEKRSAFEHIKQKFETSELKPQLGGIVAFQVATDELAEKDLARGEMFAMPAVLVLLVLIFGGLLAAGLPLLIGIFAILGAFTATRILTEITDISTFAVNTIVLLGLGMAIDYSLFIVSRFRDELRTGMNTTDAIVRTMATAGRTVFVSGVLIASALLSLLIFPQVFLRSIGLGGIAAVLLAMFASLTVLPALLAVVGRRVDALRVPWLTRRGENGNGDATDGGWARLAHSVMRRPVLYIGVVAAVLLLMGSPALDVKFSGVDERVMPEGTEARVVTERLASEFPGASAAPIDVLLSGASEVQKQEFVSRVGMFDGVEAVQTLEERDSSSLFRVSYIGERTGDAAQNTVRNIREMSLPPGIDVSVGGRTAADLDRLESLGSRLPWMFLLMGGVTFILLLMAFRSVLLPIKAVLMNIVSIGASFGVVVWIFQEGHLSDWLGFTTTGFIEPTVPVLVLVILFGLATDYEVFLLSRVREEWDKTGDNTQAVAMGMQQTGRIITAAALLLIVVASGFASGGVTITKMIGVSMVIGIAVDATLVRMLLVPATMRVAGAWTWWPRRSALQG